ncbi:MAG TPA: glycosyltransferase family 4 protein [Acidimicrobiales bacterium]|nr:glycosyltransferase family 4 protein [Acidimicrobiales bacterium]
MKLVFVTPRYGTEVIGGAETAARMLAERLCVRPGWEVEVLTSCALDHLTWANTEPPGTSVVNGVTVRRFPTASQRTLEYFELDARLRVAPQAASLADARRWVALNGPMCPDLVDAVAASDGDVIACYPYLFATTVDAIAVARAPVVLHPAAHDEPALYLPAFRRSFRDIDGLVYHTRAERDLMEHVFRIGARPQTVLGLGVNDPAGAGRPGGAILGLGDRPYLCYLGRVDEHKGCGMLADYFAEYKARRPGDLALAFVGPVSAASPDHPDIVVTGTVSEADKWDILAGAQVMVTPSAYESFSLVVLEAWTLGVPVLVNGACAATMEHCTRSGGGLWFDSYRSFEATVDRLTAEPGLRAALGGAGREYTARNYSWPAIIDRYTAFLTEVAARGPAAPLRTVRLEVPVGGTPYVRESGGRD